MKPSGFGRDAGVRIEVVFEGAEIFLFGLLAVDLAIGLIGFAGVTADVVSLVLSIVFAIYCGMNANQWYRRDLERKGYVIKGPGPETGVLR